MGFWHLHPLRPAGLLAFPLHTRLPVPLMLTVTFNPGHSRRLPGTLYGDNYTKDKASGLQHRPSCGGLSPPSLFIRPSYA